MTDDHQYWRRPDPDQQQQGTRHADSPAGTPIRIRDASFGAAPAGDSAVPPADTKPAVKATRRRWLVPTAVAAVAVVVAGIAVVSASGPAPRQASTVAGQTTGVTVFEMPGERRERLAGQIAQRRTAALRAGDQAAWLADIAPTATTVIAREKMRFANLRQMKLSYFNLLPRDYNSAVRAQTERTTGRVLVEEIMRLPADNERSATVSDWSIDFDGDRAQIVGIAPGKDPESVNYAPWDDAPLEVAHGAGVTVFAAANSRWNPRTYLPAAQRAAALVRSLWGKRLAVPGFVIFLADQQQYTYWYDNGDDLDGSAGYATFPPIVETDDGRGRVARPNPTVLHKPNEPSWIERAAGARIVLAMDQIDSVREAQRIMAHEMGHAIGPHLLEEARVDLGPKGTTSQAIWPIEGFARWVEFLDDPAYASAAMRTVRTGRAKYRPAGLFPASDEFYAADSRQRSYNYHLSSSMFLAAAQTGGRQKAVDLYICLTNQREFLTDTEQFIDVCITDVGLDPDQVWPRQRRLTT